MSTFRTSQLKTGGPDISALSLPRGSAPFWGVPLRLARLQYAKEDLESAMKSRTRIDMAVGAIMAPNRCSQDEEMATLVRASISPNIKLRDVAAGVIESISPRTEVVTYFDECRSAASCHRGPQGYAPGKNESSLDIGVSMSSRDVSRLQCCFNTTGGHLAIGLAARCPYHLTYA